MMTTKQGENYIECLELPQTLPDKNSPDNK